MKFVAQDDQNEQAGPDAPSARDHDKFMRSGGPTGMTKKKKKKKVPPRPGALNVPMQPVPPGVQAP